MNWEAVSAIGEWVGTIIVIVTLIYLARQVRLNTVTNRVAGISAIADAAREIHFTLAGDRPAPSWRAARGHCQNT